MAREAMRLWPDLPQMMQANRAFLRRAVRFVAAAGVTQFLDIGSGIPTVGNSHEVARQVDPAARVLYVDLDPVAVAHSRAILGDDPQTKVVQADLRNPDSIINCAEARALLDFRQPIALLVVAVLHFLPDEDDPAARIARLREAMAPGSYLVISHASQDGFAELADSHRRLYARTPTPMTMRSREQIQKFFDGFKLVAPGLVPLAEWRREPSDDMVANPTRMAGFAGVGLRTWET